MNFHLIRNIFIVRTQEQDPKRVFKCRLAVFDRQNSIFMVENNLIGKLPCDSALPDRMEVVLYSSLGRIRENRDPQFLGLVRKN